MIAAIRDSPRPRDLTPQPACGIVQVSDAARFRRRTRHLPRFIADHLEKVAEA